MTADRRGRLVRYAIRLLVLAGALAIVLFVRGAPAPDPEPTPAPAIVPVAGHLDVVGEAPPGFVQALGVELSTVLRRAYEQAFLPPPAPEDAEATPTPGPRLTDLFTSGAGQAIRTDRAVFGAPSDVELRGGRVTFSGVATHEDGRALSAYVSLTFSAQGTSLPDDDEPPRGVRLRQRGHLLLDKGGDGWLIAGYDLELAERREIIDEGPRALAVGRWLP